MEDYDHPALVEVHQFLCHSPHEQAGSETGLYGAVPVQACGADGSKENKKPLKHVTTVLHALRVAHEAETASNSRRRAGPADRQIFFKVATPTALLQKNRL